MELTEKQKEQRRQAVARYQSTVDRINCQLPMGTKDRIKRLTGISCNAYIKELVLRDLDKLERANLRKTQ